MHPSSNPLWKSCVFYVFQGIVDHKDDNFYKKRNFLPNYDTRRKGYSLIDEIIIKVNSEYIGNILNPLNQAFSVMYTIFSSPRSLVAIIINCYSISKLILQNKTRKRKSRLKNYVRQVNHASILVRSERTVSFPICLKSEMRKKRYFNIIGNIAWSKIQEESKVFYNGRVFALV